MASTALTGQLPQFIGSTGGLLNSAETEEKYAITWSSNADQAFELPTGGAAMMNSGENIMYFARKEQCLALGTAPHQVQAPDRGLQDLSNLPWW